MAKTRMNFRLDEEVVQKLDEMVGYYNDDEFTFKTITRTDIIQYAILQLHKDLTVLEDKRG